MASKQTLPISYKALLSMIPFIIDFLDIDCDEILASGIIDDDLLDEAIVAMLMCHKKSKVRSPQTTVVQLEDPTKVPVYSLTQIVGNSQHLVPTHFDSCSFRQHFRMSSSLFETLLQDVVTLTSLREGSRGNDKTDTASRTRAMNPTVKDSPPVSFEPQVMLLLTLRFLGSKQTVKQLADTANMTESLFTDILYQTLDALYELMQFHIKWPEVCNTAEVTQYFQEKYTLPSVLGNIDVLHIKVNAPDEHKDYYCNPHGDTTLILQTVCDHKRRFIHCSAGWPGSVDETSVFRDSDLYSDVHFQVTKYFPNDLYLVGDEAYPLMEWLMKPFHQSENLTPVQKHFNTACHAISGYSTEAYSFLLARFPRLEFVDMDGMERKVITILVCCALHNFCINGGDEMFESVQVKGNFNSPPSKNSDTESKQGTRMRQKILQCFTSFNSEVQE